MDNLLMRIKALELALKLTRQSITVGTTSYNAQDVVEDAKTFLVFIKEPEERIVAYCQICQGKCKLPAITRPKPPALPQALFDMVDEERKRMEEEHAVAPCTTATTMPEKPENTD